MTAQAALSIVEKSPDLMDKVMPVVEDARALQVITKDDVEMARSMGKGINALISTVESTFRPIKQAQDAAKKITLEQEKRHLAPLQEAKGILASKMGDWDRAERARIEEEQRLLAQEQERKRQVALKAAQNKLDALTQNLTTDQERLTLLESRLTDPTISDEEAEVVRSQIRTTRAHINTTVERAQVVEQHVEEVAQPIAPTINSAEVKTATGVSQTKEITAINTKVLLRYLTSEDCIVDAATLIDWKEGQIKKLVNSGMNLPGVSWKFASKTRF